MNLDKLAEADVGSREGVSLDHVARGRIHYLIGQHTAIVTQTQTADAKAAALLAVVGIAASRGVDLAGTGQGERIFSMIVLMFSLGVGIACLAALMPRYARNRERRAMLESDRFSWPALSSPDFTPDEYARWMRTADVSQLVVSLAHSNALVSRILHQKFRMLRLAFLLAIADALVLAAGVALWPD